MYSITKNYQASYQDRGSKFIGLVFPANDTMMFAKALNRIQEKYPDASHNCYAYRVNPEHLEEFSSDDGEPGGTAGLPILNELKSAGLCNVGLIVVRYFGGSKLGKPGLIKAYGSTARKCIEKADILQLEPFYNFEIHYAYPVQKHIDQLKHNFNLSIQNEHFTESVTLQGYCLGAEVDALQNMIQKLSAQFGKSNVRGTINTESVHYLAV